MKCNVPSIIDSYKGQSKQIRLGNLQGWVIAKPLPPTDWLTLFYHAWLVFTGRATAVYFAEDLVDKKEWHKRIIDATS